MNTVLGLITLDTPKAIIIFALTLGVLAFVFWLCWVEIGKMKLSPNGDRGVRIVLGVVAILVLLRLIGVY